jgi:hypothetical protein
MIPSDIGCASGAQQRGPILVQERTLCAVGPAFEPNVPASPVAHRVGSYACVVLRKVRSNNASVRRQASAAACLS